MKNIKPGHSCPIVCLDAGHYGDYNRSPVVPAYYESHMVWKLHLLLKAQLEKYGIQVIPTRDDPNIDLSLSRRGAQAEGVDLFLSLHSNACDTESVDRPVGIYFVDDDCGEIDVQSMEVAGLLACVVAEVMQTNDPAQTYSRRSTNSATDDYYTVLYASHKAGTAGVILEHSFHTNARAAAWLLEEENLQKLAEAEAAALAEYFGVDNLLRYALPFEDVSEDAWYYDAVRWAFEQSITVGRDATHFDPNTPITRAEMAAMLYRFNNSINNT